MKLSELITTDDNSTLEPAYVLWVLAVIVGLGLEVFSVFSGKPFDLQAYGLGTGALLAFGGLGKKLGA